MCGIAGLATKGGRPIEPALLDRMTDAIAHRGPDDRGTFIDGDVGLGHRRLSIFDLSPLGHQPMASPSGRYVAVYNGEIYNFQELRAELSGRGFSFRGGSDTEVLVAGFEAWGIEQTVKRCAGMFAFAVFDRETRDLTLARDRFGIKPLYYADDANGFCFGSELRALTPALSDRSIDPEALGLMLAYKYVPSPFAIYRGVKKLEPAQILTRRADGRIEISTYWSIARAAEAGLEAPFQGSEAQALEALEALLRLVVREHLAADVPVGLLLSGGVDSSLVAAMAHAEHPLGLRTFSIGFETKAFDEAPFAAAIAKHLNTTHTELYLTNSEALAAAPMIASIYDEPFADESQLPTYLIAKKARQAVTVVLTGDGGDELFGGYDRYVFTSTYWRRLAGFPGAVRKLAAAGVEMGLRAGAGALIDPLGERLRVARPSEKLAKAAGVLAAGDFAALHRLMVRNPLLADLALGSPAAMGGFDGGALPLPRHDLVSRQMAHDARYFMSDGVLTKVDRATMAVALEARPPLLDHRVAEFAWTLPIAWKVSGRDTKKPLRNLLARHVPPALFERPKMGFSVPIAEWLRGPLKSWAGDLLSPQRLRAQGLLNTDGVEKLWRGHQNGGLDHSAALWRLAMFQAWLDAQAGR